MSNFDNTPAVNMTDLIRISKLALSREQFQPLLISGPPGIAKTHFFRHVFTGLFADSLGIQQDQIGYIEEQLACRDAAEVAGVALPKRDDSGAVYTEFTKPPLITKIEQQIAKGFQYGVINLDEVLQCGADMQKILSPVLDPETRTLSGWDIPEGWIVVGTGNRVADKSGATRLLAMLGDRVRLFELTFEIAAWASWAEANGIHPIIIDCAMAYSDQDFFATSVPTETGPFCTPRSLVQAARDFQQYIENDAGTDVENLPRWFEQMLAGNIGPSAASTVVGFVAQTGHIPSEDALLRRPESANVPDQTGFQMLAGSKALALATTLEKAEAVITYIVRLRPDLQVTLANRLLTRSTREGWVLTNGIANEFVTKFSNLNSLQY